MPLPPETTRINAPNFAALSQQIMHAVEDELHRRPRPPVELRVYLNSQIAEEARLPEHGTALIAWAEAQGIGEIKIRVDESKQLLASPECAYWLRWN